MHLEAIPEVIIQHLLGHHTIITIIIVTIIIIPEVNIQHLDGHHTNGRSLKYHYVLNEEFYVLIFVL